MVLQVPNWFLPWKQRGGKASENVKIQYGLWYVPADQAAAVTALTGDRDCVYDTMKAYEARRDILCDGLRSIGWEMDRPVATMFVWAPIPKQYESSEAFVMDTVEKDRCYGNSGKCFSDRLAKDLCEWRWYRTEKLWSAPYMQWMKAEFSRRRMHEKFHERSHEKMEMEDPRSCYIFVLYMAIP